MAAGRVGTLVSPDYSANYSTTSSQPQAGANRGMTLEAPSAPDNQYRGTGYRSNEYRSNGYGVGTSPRMAARPQTPNLPVSNASGQYSPSTKQTYPTTGSQRYSSPQSQTPYTPYTPYNPSTY